MHALDDDREQLLAELQSLRARLAVYEQAAASGPSAPNGLPVSEHSWRQLAQSAPDVICMIDRDGKILLLNRAVAGAKQAEEYLGVNCYNLIPAEQHDVFRRAMEHVFQTGQPTGYEVPARGLDGLTYWWASHIGPVLEQGKVVAVTAAATDITARKLVEEQLKIASAELARSNRELEQFAFIASHDLQEPLRKVLTFGDLLIETNDYTLGDQQRDYIQRMQNAARRMQVLIDDLLAFSRVATQPQPFATVDLAQLAAEVVSDLEALIRKTEGRVEIGPLPQLNCDPLQMRQLLQNLLGNALKFHRSDEPPQVRIEGRRLAQVNPHPRANAHQAHCEITVRDQGIGFDEKYLEHIFAPLQRLHGRGEYEGTGMGLAICRKIVERHGGTITARSALGQGATFIVTLPLEQPTAT